MLLRHRPPDIDAAPATLSPGLEHLDQRSVAVLRWLNANKIDYVLVGPVAYAIRGQHTAFGPIAIVPAPYLRNYERLTAALTDQDATLRSTRSGGGERAMRGADPVLKLTADKLARGRRWLLSFAGYDLDVESSSRRAAGVHGPHTRPGAGEAPAPIGDGVRYQELLYEAIGVQVADGLTVQVAAPEDLEHYSQVRRTGVAPEFRIHRNDGSGDGEAGSEHPAASADS
jgi:hypothetical protein